VCQGRAVHAYQNVSLLHHRQLLLHCNSEHCQTAAQSLNVPMPLVSK
jgi:hypothetical protein